MISSRQVADSPGTTGAIGIERRVGGISKGSNERCDELRLARQSRRRQGSRLLTG